MLSTLLNGIVPERDVLFEGLCVWRCWERWVLMGVSRGFVCQDASSLRLLADTSIQAIRLKGCVSRVWQCVTMRRRQPARA